MGFAVLHIEKIKSGAGSLGAHIDRLKGQEHTYRNANAELIGQNKKYITGDLSKLPLGHAIHERIKRGYTGEKAIRKDAVRGLSIVLTGSHEDMKRIMSNPDTQKAWVDTNYAFLVKEFGKENIVRLALHMDEKTPHLHAVVVPLKDGQLSAKVIMGDRIAMSGRQTRYADAVKKFELNRGIVGSKAIHNGEGWYLGQQKQAQETILRDIPAFGMMDRLNPSKYVNNLTEGLKLAVKKTKDAELLAENRDKRLSEMRNAYNSNTQKLEKDLKITREQLSLSSRSLWWVVKENLKQDLSPQEKQSVEEIKSSFLEHQQELKKQQEKEQNQVIFQQKKPGFKR